MPNELMPVAAAVAVLAGLAALPYARARLQLSRAKHRSLAGHSRLAKRVARLVPGYCYSDSQFFQADHAPTAVALQRRSGFIRLGSVLRERSPRTLALTGQARSGISDLQFTGRYRVPFQFSPLVRDHLPIGAFWEASEGLELIDLDGVRHLDLTGSYGVNVFGHAFYKSCMAAGSQTCAELGVVLGGYHPCVAEVVERLKAISGLSEVSFHMSGTEAVMQAVRLARYHTGKRHLVRFTGAYHGWWEDVQPGPGNPMPPRDTYTLQDMSEAALQVLRRRKDIACVLVNPLQALHPNRNAPGDSTLLDGSRTAGFDRAAYAKWLQRLRQVCTERGIVLILDEVFVGFRLALGGAQQYFGVQADLVCYGKTLGGGFPVGVVCGRAELMRRFNPERPADLCFARGTFNAHPTVMGAMHEFLQRLDSPEVQRIYQGLDATWDGHLRRFNEALAQAGYPVRAEALSSIWTLTYTQPSRYHWMLQFYLREQGLALSWVGTGRFIFSLNYTEADMAEVTRRVLAACAQMQHDGWWWQDETQTQNAIRRQMRLGLLLEMLAARWRTSRAASWVGRRTGR
jgi:glutamate-1-semialdehyde 2,1-aminomutase